MFLNKKDIKWSILGVAIFILFYSINQESVFPANIGIISEFAHMFWPLIFIIPILFWVLVSVLIGRIYLINRLGKAVALVTLSAIVIFMYLIYGHRDSEYTKNDCNNPLKLMNVNFSKESCLHNVARDTQNPSVCNEMEGKKKSSCFLDLANITKDFNLCSKIPKDHNYSLRFCLLAKYAFLDKCEIINSSEDVGYNRGDLSLQNEYEVCVSLKKK